MEIKRQTINTEAVAITDNARYQVNTVIVHDRLNDSIELHSVTADVFDKQLVEVPGVDGMPEMQEEERLVGTLGFAFSKMNTNNFPYTEKYALYVADFMEIIDGVRNPKKEEESC